MKPETIYLIIGVIFATGFIIFKRDLFEDSDSMGAIGVALSWFLLALVWFPITFLGLLWLFGKLLMLASRIGSSKKPRITDAEYEQVHEKYWSQRLDDGR